MLPTYSSGWYDKLRIMLIKGSLPTNLTCAFYLELGHQVGIRPHCISTASHIEILGILISKDYCKSLKGIQNVSDRRLMHLYYPKTSFLYTIFIIFADYRRVAAINFWRHGSAIKNKRNLMQKLSITTICHII